jgi:4-amino-4-deoxy-L-arabinose transferase-like glycosyltransferase
MTTSSALPIDSAAAPETDVSRPKRRISPLLREIIAAILMIIAIALMILAAYWFKPANRLIENPPLGQAALAALGGAVAIGVAIRVSRRSPSFMLPTTQALAPTRTHWLITGGGMLLLALGTEMSARVTGLELFSSISPIVQFLFLLAGICLFAWGLCGAPRSLANIARGEAGIVLLIVVLAFIVRAYGLDQTIRGSIDEMHFSDGVRQFWGTPNLRLLSTTSDYLPPTMLYSLWNAATVELFGRNFVGLRMINAILGAATIPIVYLLAKAFFDRKTALAAALILATFPPHMQFSRIAMGQIGDALFGTMMIMCFARGFKTNQRSDWVLGGVALGMTQYFYEGGRLIFPPIALGMVILTLLFWGFRRMRVFWRGIGLACFAALITIIPVYFTMLVTGTAFSSRLNESRISDDYFSNIFEGGLDDHDLGELNRRFTDPFLVYVFGPDLSGEFYGSDQPMILTIFVPIFLLGVAHILMRPRAPALIILPWIAIASAGNIFLSNSLLFNRYVMVMPALATLLAVGVRYTLPMLIPTTLKRARQASPLQSVHEDESVGARLASPAETSENASRWDRRGWVIVAGVVCLIAAFHLWWYFNPFMQMFNLSYRNAKPYRDAHDAVLRVLDETRDPSNTETWVFGTFDPDTISPRLLLRFFVTDNYPLTARQSDRITVEELCDFPRDRDYVFFIEPIDQAMYDKLSQCFTMPAPTYTRANVPVTKAYLMYTIPQENAALPAG